jgi:hypothetical protein
MVKFRLKRLKGLSTVPSVLSTPEQVEVIAIVARVPWTLAGDQP